MKKCGRGNGAQTGLIASEYYKKKATLTNMGKLLTDCGQYAFYNSSPLWW
jgi:hypothetical protein